MAPSRVFCDGALELRAVNCHPLEAKETTRRRPFWSTALVCCFLITRDASAYQNSRKLGDQHRLHKLCQIVCHSIHDAGVYPECVSFQLEGAFGSRMTRTDAKDTKGMPRLSWFSHPFVVSCSTTPLAPNRSIFRRDYGFLSPNPPIPAQ